MTLLPIERKAKRLRIYIGESDQWQGRPLYAALLETLKKEGLAGATVVRGVAGFGAHSRIHTAAILDLSTDLPLIVEVVDSPEKIQHAVEMVSAMVREGLVTLEDVEVISYLHRYLCPLPADRPVKEVMTRDPVAVLASQTALEAWESMLRQNLKALPVVDEARRVVGLLAHADFLERAGLSARLAVAQKLDEESLSTEITILRGANLTVQEVMSQPAITIHPDDSLGLAAGRLVQHHITRLPVVDQEGKLVGMLSRLDVLRQVVDPSVAATPIVAMPEAARPEAAMPEAARPPDISEKTQKRETVRSAGKLAKEVMGGKVPLVREDTDLAGVVASFVSSGEHRVIVVSAEGLPLGLISDSDVVGRIQPAHRRGILGALRGRSELPDVSVTARELMSPGVETISGSTPLVEAVTRMVKAGRKWLVVVDDQGRPAGLIDREIALEALIR